VAAVVESQRIQYERGLAYLGTLGSNAPFIGLFGTVMGIVRAFHDLARSSAALGTQAVMAGIAEALVATAVGLLVAIPRSPPTTCSCATWKPRWPRRARWGTGFWRTSKAVRPRRIHGQRGKVMAAGSRRRGLITDINVTPLVDIMLVLLIIFMLTAHLIARQVIEVQLPRPRRPRPSARPRWP